MMDPMKHALAKRRGKGIDLTISISPSKDDEKSSDLAPKGDVPPEPADGEGVALSPVNPEPHDDMDAQMLGGMSEHDLHDMKGRKPRSLGERAKQGAMQRMQK